MSDCTAFACASRGCQATIHLHHDIEKRLRRTHETFYCPAGHSNYFPGKTSEEKRLADLEARAARLERQRDMWQGLAGDAREQADDWPGADPVYATSFEVDPSRKCPFDHAPDSLWDFPGDYWTVIEAALVGLPDHDRLRAPALASLDHLKAVITSRGAAS